MLWKPLNPNLEFRGYCNEKNILKKLLEKGVDEKKIEDNFCLYFWCSYFTSAYDDEIFYHSSGEKNGVVTSLSVIDYDFLKNRHLFWMNQKNLFEKEFSGILQIAIIP